MSKNFIQIPKSLLEHPSVISAPPAQRWVLITLIQRFLWREKIFDDHGMQILVKPGQIITTYRELADWANVTKNDAERGIKRFLKDKILSQEVRHTKSIISIIHSETYDLITKAYETTSETKVRQERDKIETEKNIENISIPTISSLRSEIVVVPNSAASAVYFCMETKELKNISQAKLIEWQNIFSLISVSSELAKIKEWYSKDLGRAEAVNRSSDKNLWLAKIEEWLQKNHEEAKKKPAKKAINKTSPEAITKHINLARMLSEKYFSEYYATRMEDKRIIIFKREDPYEKDILDFERGDFIEEITRLANIYNFKENCA